MTTWMCLCHCVTEPKELSCKRFRLSGGQTDMRPGPSSKALAPFGSEAVGLRLSACAGPQAVVSGRKPGLNDQGLQRKTRHSSDADHLVTFLSVPLLL